MLKITLICVIATYYYPVTLDSIPFNDIHTCIAAAGIEDSKYIDDITISDVLWNYKFARKVDIGVGGGNGWTFMLIDGEIVKTYFDGDEKT